MPVALGVKGRTLTRARPFTCGVTIGGGYVTDCVGKPGRAVRRRALVPPERPVFMTPESDLEPLICLCAVAT